MTVDLTNETRAALTVLFEQNAPIQRILERAEASIVAAIRGPVRGETLIRSALLQISITPALQKCDKMSIVQAVMQAASLGLLVGGPAGEAALVPRKSKAVLTPMVRGLVTLAMRSGTVLAVSPTAVYPGEKFKVFRGTRNEIIHEADLDLVERADDTKVRYVYTVFQMAGGVNHFDVMNRAEVEKVRASSAAKDDGPWVTHWGEMAKKTVTKRASKMMVLSPEFRAAVELDNRFETGHINEPSEILDRAEDISQHVKAQTVARTDALRERIGVDRALGEGSDQPIAVEGATEAVEAKTEASYVTGRFKCRTCGATPGTPHKKKCPNG